MHLTIINFFQRLIQHRYMVRSMVARDIRARYVGSMLGIFWSVIHPALQMAIYYFVFSLLLRIRLGQEYENTSFATWLIVGLLPWMLFAEILTRSPQAILEHSALVKRTAFPSELIPFARLLAACLNHGISLGLVVIIISFFGHIPSFAALAIVPYFLAIGLFSLGLSWLLAAVNVFLRDIGQIVNVTIQIWFYLTPVIYPTNLIPERWRPWMWSNPLMHAVEGYRMTLLTGLIPPPAGLLYLIATGALGALAGGWLFRRLKTSFADAL